MTKPATPFWRTLLGGFAPIFGCILMLWLLWNIETRFMPVVTDFRIVSATLDKDKYTAVGTLNKRRGCQIVNLAIVRVRDQVPLSILDTQAVDLFSADASTGLHTWGPVTLPISSHNLLDTDRIQIVALHRCHAFWLKQTVYTQASWEALKLLASPTSKGQEPRPSTGELGTTHYFIRVAPVLDRY